MISWDIFEIVVLVPVLIAFDCILLASILILATSLLLKGIWRLARIDYHRVVPLHLAIVAVITVWVFVTGLDEVLGTIIQHIWRLLLGGYDGIAPLRILAACGCAAFLYSLAAALKTMHGFPVCTKQYGWGLANSISEQVILADGSHISI